MKNKIFRLIYFSSVFFILACNTENKSVNDPDSSLSSPTVAYVDSNVESRDPANLLDANRFILDAAASGLMKIEAAKVAQNRGHDEMIKIFADQMIQDSSRARQELDSLAKFEGIVLPLSLSADQVRRLGSLERLHGGAFDSHYISMMVNEHKNDVNRFKLAATCQNAKIKAFAHKELRVVELNSSMAVDVQFNLTNKYSRFLK